MEVTSSYFSWLETDHSVSSHIFAEI